MSPFLFGTNGAVSSASQSAQFLEEKRLSAHYVVFRKNQNQKIRNPLLAILTILNQYVKKNLNSKPKGCRL